MKFIEIISLTLGCSFAGAIHCQAAQVGLQQATATFSQTFSGNFSVGTAINGTAADLLGWAIVPQTGSNQTAVFETTANMGSSGGSLLTFTLTQAYSAWGEHTLGRFRLSLTTDDRSTFADGLPSGGDVTANWTVLDPSVFVSAQGATMTEQPDHSILMSGVSPITDTYVVAAETTLTGITGVRLEALSDPSLPFGGPGRQPINGNFTLSEFSVDLTPIPEPSTCTLVLLGAAVFAALRRRSRVG